MSEHQRPPRPEPPSASGEPEPRGGRPPATPGTVTVRHLVVLQALACRRWDTAIIVALGNGPSRFVDLRDAAATWMRRPCYNAELARTLPKLLAAGYITGPDDDGDGTYALTNRGRARLAVVNALGGALDDQPTPNLANI